MNDTPDYFALNQELWDHWTGWHVHSDFYAVESVLAGADPLRPIETELLGVLTGQRLLHLQCHFGLDSLALARRGARVTGVDLSPQAVAAARELAQRAGLPLHFVCCNVYDALEHIAPEGFDVVFSSYGTIVWLPDLKPWAQVVAGALRTGGRLVFVDFHPVLMMLSEASLELQYAYFNRGPVLEMATGSYADRSQTASHPSVTWNHSLADVLGALLNAGLELRHFAEYDYSPFDCFRGLQEKSPGHYQLAARPGLLPMIFSIVAQKQRSDFSPE